MMEFYETINTKVSSGRECKVWLITRLYIITKQRDIYKYILYLVCLCIYVYKKQKRSLSKFILLHYVLKRQTQKVDRTKTLDRYNNLRNHQTEKNNDSSYVNITI